jgi:methyl acetate hydrolase
MQRHGLPNVITCRRAALETPLLADPGERWEYGIGIDWAGLAVEAVTGQRLEEVLRERVLGALGMSDTAFRIGTAQRARLAAMHARGRDGSLSVIPFEVPQDPEFQMGGGGLYGTARDYLRFCRMVLNGGALDGARILQPETVAEMGRNQTGALAVGKLKSAIPASSNDAEFFPGMAKRWSLAFLMNEEDAPGGGRSAGSLSWAGLANTYYWIDPKRDLAGVVVTQILPFGDPKALDLLMAFERALYATH